MTRGGGVDAERARCAANNVDWYRAVLAPHGIAGSIEDGLWACRDQPPPYYSNAVTVDPDPVGAQLAAIASLGAAVHRPFTVKDSFDRLDLAPLGFAVLFAAEWIQREPRSAVDGATDGGGADVDWRPVETSDELAAWEAAWRANGSPAASRVFLPALLKDPEVRMFAAHRAGRIVAGCAANRSSDVVGFSNYFAEDQDDGALLGAAVAAAAGLAPGMPIVGYERGAALERARALGFRSVGSLRVWIHPGSSADGG